jgi:hypothetical protein
LYDDEDVTRTASESPLWTVPDELVKFPPLILYVPPVIDNVTALLGSAATRIVSDVYTVLRSALSVAAKVFGCRILKTVPYLYAPPSYVVP